MQVPADFDLEASVNEYRAAAARRAEADGEKLRQNFAVATIADAHGWRHDWSPGATWTVDLHVDVADLAAVRKAFGKLRLYGKDLRDHVTRMVRVTLHCEDYPQLRVNYQKAMPAEQTGKCRIVRNVQAASEYYSLVCDR